MRIPRRYIEAYSSSLNEISERGRAAITDALAEIDLSGDVADVRALVTAIMQTHCGASSTVAARLAADFYDGLRARFGIEDGFRAEVDGDYEPEATEGAVRAFAQDLVEGKPDSFIAKCADRLDREVRLSANQCVEHNARRDPKKPRWARVPTGPETCRFCVMLASRGFVYHSEELASHAHANCDCRVVPSWDKAKAAVEGYDPDYYRALYNDPEAAKHMALPGPKQMTPEEQRNIGPDAPMFRKRTTATTIAECARDANPHYVEIATAIGERDKLIAELNSMLPITRDNVSEYTRKYKQFETAKKDVTRLYRKWSQNCQRCVTAYELRRRGYDVTARERLARNDVTASRWKSYFVNQQWTNVGDSDATIALSNLENELAGYGDGSRSIVYVVWQSGNAHVFIAERQHGKTVYIDPQSGQVDYDWASRVKPNYVQVSRVDDKEVDASIIKKVVKEGQ